jgi:hypothetical protein
MPDPRSYGSGNPGATNVLRSGRKAIAALTLAGDGGKGGNVVNQGGKDGAGLWWLGGLEHLQCSGSKRSVNCLETGDEVGQKADQVAVIFVEGKPGKRPFALGNPLADDGGFAKTGRGGDEGQLCPVVESLV